MIILIHDYQPIRRLDSRHLIGAVSVELLSTKTEKKKKNEKKRKSRHQVLTVCSVDCPES